MSGDTSMGMPSRLNACLVALVLGIQAGLLLLASHCPSWQLLVITPLFAMLFLTNYALMHESSHGALHHRPWANRLLGILTGWTFPTSATMMRVTHIVHHRCNRTDHELFDGYYPGDRRWLKILQWYSILTGLFYLIIPLGPLVIAVGRPLLLTGPFKAARSSSVLFDDFTAGELWLVRGEVVVLAALYIAAFVTGVLQWGPTLLLFAAGGINWSTRQYVTHAWSRRDVIHGAHNLKAGPLMRAILLNGNWDLVHHQHPMASWTELPRLAPTSLPPIGFWRQYLSQWRGPRLVVDAAPPVLEDLRISG